MKLNPQKYRELRKYAHFVHDIGQLGTPQLAAKYPEWAEYVFPGGRTSDWSSRLYYLLGDYILNGKPLKKAKKKTTMLPEGYERL